MLQLVVQHVSTLDDRWVLRLLQTNSTVRAALQEGVGRLSVGNWPLSLANQRKVTGFGAWFPKHCGLVQSLFLSLPSGITDNEQQGWEAAEQVITFALQFCALPAGMRTPTAAPAQCKAGTAGGLLTTALQLRCFHSNFVYSPAALHSLASCTSLTRLYLRDVQQERLTGSFVAAMGHLPSLKELVLLTDDDTLFPCTFAAAVGQLTQLESLYVNSGSVHAQGLAQLPPSLTNININIARVTGGPADISLGHVSNLQDLTLHVPGGVSAQSSLPAGLKSLMLCGPAEGVRGLEGLTCLLLDEPQASLSLLQRVPQLSQLQTLRVGLEYCSREQIEQVFAAIAAGTQLTALHAYCTDTEQEDDTYAGVSCEGVLLHRYLQRLPQLRQLHLSGLQLDTRDAMHFTALSALTDLRLAQCDISDVAVAAILQRLTGLRVLVLDELCLTSPVVWVAAACLTNLEDLCCRMNTRAAVTEDTLHLLAPLTKLTNLELDMPAGEDGHAAPINRAVVAEFLAGMPLLNDIDFC